MERSDVKVAIEVSAGTGSDSVRGSDSPEKDDTKTLIVSMIEVCVVEKEGVRMVARLEMRKVNEMRRKKKERMTHYP